MEQEQEIPLIDFNALDTLKMALKDRFQTVSDLFVEQTPKKIEELKRNLENGNSGELRATAHSLKGSCANFAALGLSATFKIIEEKGRDGNLEGVEDHIKKAEEQFEEVKSLLEKYD